MIQLKVNNIFVDILGEFSLTHWKKLEKQLSFRPQGYQFSPAFNRMIYHNGKVVRRVWDGWKHQIWKNKKRFYFPTGLFSLVQEYLKENNIDYQVQDVRTHPESNIDLCWSTEFSPRPYQTKVIDDACNRSRGIIHAATGSGKTIMAAGIISKLNVTPFLFFVTSIDLLVQAKESLEQALKLQNSSLKVGQIGGGVIDIKDINVVTIQTAMRVLVQSWDKKTKFDDEDSDDKTPIEERKEDILNLLHSAKGSICDEVQHWRADTCQMVARELHSAYYTFGMSATPYRDEGDDMMIQACFGKKIAEITASQLIREGWLLRPNIKMVHIKKKKSVYKQWQSIYQDQITENVYYNNVIANITNSYISHDRLVLVLVRQIKHGKLLEQMIPGSLFLSGSSSKKDRIEGIRNLRRKEISCIVSSTIFDEGIDVKPLDTVILAGQGKSKTRAMQRIGRIIRPFPNKKVATAVDFCVHQKYLRDHATARSKMYNTEPEYDIEDIDITQEVF